MTDDYNFDALFAELLATVLEEIKAGAEIPVAIAQVVRSQVDLRAALPQKGFEKTKRKIEEGYEDSLILAAGLTIAVLHELPRQE